MVAKKTWHFDMRGIGHDGHDWQTYGNVHCEFLDVATEALKVSFQLLTEGKAVYGQPGPCGGPYQVTHFEANIDARLS